MGSSWKLVSIFALWVVGIACFGLILAAAGWGSLIVLIASGGVLGWITYAFLYYRYCRREELLHLLAGSIEDGVPLAPALRAFVQDRPRGPMRNFWLACLLGVLPVPGFYWIWYRQNNFDRRIEELARLLEQGVPLHQCLQMLPVVATRETALAAAIGESTGQLGRCLRESARRRMSTIWIDLVPQFAYPFFVLTVIGSVVTFIAYFIVPKFKKIFMDFGVDLPPLTLTLMEDAELITRYWYIVVLGIQVVLLCILIITLSSTARWFFPVLGAVYRRGVRARVLHILSVLLETGKPLPQSFAVLGRLPLGRAALVRLDDARLMIEDGEPLGDSLRRVGLLGSHMAPLVSSAERAGNLPWALRELADSMYQRTMRSLQRIMQVVFPASILALGMLVALVVTSIFVPLIQLISELSR
jgi:type IV pilus assembly protein PilC